MRSVLTAIISSIVIAAVVAVGALWYVQPEQKLDLTYTELPLRDKLASMLVSRKHEMTLTGPEVNQLLKKALAARPNVGPNLAITGAQFALQGDRLTTDVNLLAGQRVEAAATLNFTLSWREPYLTAVHTGTAVKQASIPKAWFHLDPLQVNLNAYMPPLVSVREVTFEGSDVKLRFQLR